MIRASFSNVFFLSFLVSRSGEGLIARTALVPSKLLNQFKVSSDVVTNT